MSRPERPEDFFLRIMQGYRATKALLVANRLGVFDVLQDEARTSEQIADALGCNRRSVSILLRALAAMGLLRTDGHIFENSTLARDYLTRASAHGVSANLRFQDILWECWSNLESVVRTGNPWKRLSDLISAEDIEFVGDYVRAMHRFSQTASTEVARLLSDRRVHRLLDVGGGPGTYCLAILDQNPSCQAVLLDLAPSLEVAEEILSKHGRRGQITLRRGNYLRDDYGRDFDLVLMSHVTHDESPESVQLMIHRAFSALEAGGRVAIHDWVVDDVRHIEPESAAFFSLNVLAYTDGQVYSDAEYRKFLDRAGFIHPESYDVLPGKVGNPTRLIVAEKPAQ